MNYDLKLIKTSLLAGFLSFLCTGSHAQFDLQSRQNSTQDPVPFSPDPASATPDIGPAPDGNLSPDNPGDQPVPIDGGVSILIASGIAYGYKYAKDQRRRSISER